MSSAKATIASLPLYTSAFCATIHASGQQAAAVLTTWHHQVPSGHSVKQIRAEDQNKGTLA
jgi:hypothetical protein